MYYELSKKDKKIARQLMDKGLLTEFEQGLNNFYAILQEWKKGNGEIKETYYKIFSSVTDFDKHIARRYDRIGGSRYLETVMVQLADGLFDISELEDFSPEVKDEIEWFLKVRNKTKSGQ